MDVTLLGTYQILTTLLLAIEAFYYNVVFTSEPLIFIVLLYLSWCVVFAVHRTGDGVVRDSEFWRISLFRSWVVLICVLVKVFWLLFMLGIWSDYGAMICSKSTKVDMWPLDESLIDEENETLK